MLFSRKRGSCILVVDKTLPSHSSLNVFTYQRCFGLYWDARHSANAKM